MDIYCANCAEPQDAFDLEPSERTLLNQRTAGADMRTVLFDVLGDDLDGIASIMDDGPYMGFDIRD